MKNIFTVQEATFKKNYFMPGNISKLSNFNTTFYNIFESTCMFQTKSKPFKKLGLPL